MKRLLLTGALFLCSLLTTLAQYSGSGNGTEADPYLIFNETQLSQMANFLNKDGVVFKLMKDLDLTDWIAENNPSQGWIPVGVSSSPFKGKLYGNNHKITGFTINRGSQSYVGFFGYLSGATVKDLTLEGTTVNGSTYVGFFCGSAVSNCTFSNITVKGDKVTGSNTVGFFAAQTNNCTASDIVIEGNVEAAGSVGLFAATATSLTLKTANINGSVKSTGNYAAGCVAKISSSTLTDITVSGSYSGTNYVGGISGTNNSTNITNAKVNGDITGTSYLGGITGEVSNGSITFLGCNYKGDIAGTSNLSGIAALLNTGSAITFSSCFSKGNITATGNYVGGIVANSRGGCIAGMENCSHFGDIKGIEYVGGLVGCIENITSTPDTHTWTVYRGNGSNQRYQQVYTYQSPANGQEVTASLNNCTAIGNIEGNDNIGGLIGSNTPAYSYKTETVTINANSSYWNSSYDYYYLFKDGVYSGTATSCNNNLKFTIDNYQRNKVSHLITNNYYSGNINGREKVGGIAGYKSGGSIQNNYSYATIKGKSYVGGIVGQVSGEKLGSASNTTIIKSNVSNDALLSATKDNIGRVYGSADYATVGAIGSTESNRALATCRVIRSGVVQEVEDNLQNGTSTGVSALRLKANYVSWGWDFDTNWNILETECFPYKKYQAAPPVIKSDLVSKATSISGNSVNGGTVYLYYMDHDAVSTETSNNEWSFCTEELQSGAQVQIYADVDGMTPSYFTAATVKYPGSGTEDDPYRIYTAADLQGASERGYYKLMNDIDLTEWINKNSPTKGWIAIGRNSGEATFIDGDGHKVSGLWINNPGENYNGLFSNFSAGQIKNLNVEVASGKSVIGGDYTGILIGRNANGKIVNCSVKGDVQGTTHVGGIAGYTESTTLSSLTFDGKVSSTTANAFVGGVNGSSKGSTYTLCNVAPTISATGASNNIGGLAGYVEGGSVTKSKAIATITATGNNDNVGGLIGKSSATVSLSLASGTISSTGTGEQSYTGGLVGYATNSIANSYATTKVTGGYYVAGLVAYTFSGVENCYAKGDVYGTNYGAGVVAELDGSKAQLANSIAVNNVLSLSAQSSWGSRVIGGYKNGSSDPDSTNFALNTMQVSLNNVPQKKTDDLVEGIAKTLTELEASSTYIGIGWNFSETWGIDEGEMLPYLLWEVDVNPVADITLNKTSLILAVGKNDTISASVLPLGATNKRLAWKSSNDSIATVSDGIVTAVAEGEAIITATSTDGSNISATCKVTVTANKDAAIAKLQALVDDAQKRYDNSTEGEEIGQYATGARAELLKVINEVKATISDTMSDEAISTGTSKINDAVNTFESKKVTAGEDTEISTLENAIYINKAEGRSGSSVTLSIRLKNKIEVPSYQFDIVLPEGVTAAKDSDGFYEINMSTERTTARKFDSFMSGDYGSGIRVLAFSTKNYTLTGNDGEIATIKLNVSPDMKNGDYPIILKNEVLSDPNGKAYKVDYVKSTLTISSYTLGDVNGDGEINVADITTLAGNIMGTTPAQFVQAAADMNQDGEINVADITSIASYIMNAASGNTSLAKAFGMTAEGSSLNIEPVSCAKGYNAEAEVSIINPSVNFSALQFDLTLPEGTTVEDVSLGERTSSKATDLLYFNRLSNGNYRILCASTRNICFNGSEGCVLRLVLASPASSAEGDYPLMVSNIVLADNGVAYHLDNSQSQLNISAATAIDRLGIDRNKEVDVYNLNGLKILSKVKAAGIKNRLPSGLYIIDGKKIAL